MTHAEHLRTLAALASVWRSLQDAQVEAKANLDVAIRAAHAAGVPRRDIADAAGLDYSRTLSRALEGGTG